MWRLEYPGTLVLFLLFPGLIYLVNFRKTRGGRLPFSFGVWAGQTFSTGLTVRKGLSALGWFLFWLGFALLLLALAGPVIVEKERHYLTRGIDMIIALDQSPSMSARDSGQGSRFDAAKTVIGRFVEGRENDSIGLVSFSKEAALRVPPTLDYATLINSLNRLKIMELGDGTAIGMGIVLSTVHLHLSRSREKVIILLTDGDNNAGKLGPLEAARIASELGIRIYTIGVGREGEATLEFVNPETGEQVRGVYRGKFDTALLKEIAALTGGRYFQAGGMGTLEAIFSEIDTLEKTEQQVVLSFHKTPKHNAFALSGGLLIILALFLRKGLLGAI